MTDSTTQKPQEGLERQSVVARADREPANAGAAAPAAGAPSGPGPAAATSAPTPAPAPGPAPPKKIRPARRTVVLMVFVAIAGIVLVLWAWRLWPFTGTVLTTENSYVRGQITVLAPQVSGYVSQVLVSDFQAVKAGQPLVRIDDSTYRAQVAEAEGQRDAAKAELANAEQSLAQNAAEIESRRADLSSAQAEQDRAQADEARVDELAARGSVSFRERDQTRATARSGTASVLKSRAAIRIAQETSKSTRVSREGLRAKLLTAEAQLSLARINLANTVIRAPRDGQLSEASVRTGQYVSAGSQLLFLVPDVIWVVANFKETQIRNMVAGQRATFTVDALGEQTLTGHVEGFAPATGSEFSVLRPDNASGNFTKVVQRLPVRIRIDPDQPLAGRLRPGMSVITSVDTSGTVAQGGGR